MPSAKLYPLLILMFISVVGYSQKQFNQWRFGFGSGINFNTRPPSSVTGSATLTQEGSASVADPKTGALLFYTDGITVWNSLNQPMPNGDTLVGGTPDMRSSTTAAVIVPKPGSVSIYYIVTIDEGATSPNSKGLSYSLVDMTLNGGLGDVDPSEKNVFLFQTNSERLEVVPADNGTDYWIITHDGNTFVSFRLTINGFSSPVVSTVSGNLSNSAGHLKVNSQFNRLACGSVFESSMRLFNFNNSTGVVTDLISWTLASGIIPLIYGVEFSPNGEYLYISDISNVYQYTISVLNKTAIESSLTRLSPISGFSQIATLQLGPDQRIYVNAGGGLDVITCPNIAGIACNLSSTGLQAGGYGLPKRVYSADDTVYFIPNTIVFKDTCWGNTTFLTLTDTSNLLNVSWLFDDPDSGTDNTASGNISGHVFSKPGTYKVRAVISDICGTDTLFSNVDIINCSYNCTGIIGSTSDSCLQSEISFSIISDSAITAVNWNFDDPASGSRNTSTAFTTSHRFSATGTYQVKAIVEFTCGKDTLQKTILVLPCDTASVECTMNIPNIFTPNSDKLNDNFFPLPTCETELFEFSVFNRWGQQVFTTTNPAEKWDGRTHGNECPDGVYVYLLKYKFPAQKPQYINGTVTVIR
ncbi:MAG: gliding motility-associated C-terminal domain-containing protein [Bacteroidota bacterium]